MSPSNATIQSIESALSQFGQEKRGFLSLDRFREALTFFGEPQLCAPSLIIGGTNGKGTTTLLISSALREAGIKATSYLSPHLQSPCERFLSGLAPISADTLLQLVEGHAPKARELGLSYFEFLTLLYFLWSREIKAEILILEVGLGGRLDATNVTDPLASVITTIDYDHMEYLGETLPQILREKLGILRPEGLLFTGIHDPKLKDIAEAHCAEIDAVYYYADELRIEQVERTWETQSFTLNGFPIELTCPTIGARQSAALAWLMLRIVFPKISLSTLAKAFRRVVNPGRFETISRSPRIILSGDHNPSGMDSLVECVQSLGQKVRVVAGFSPDKPFEEMMRRVRQLDPNPVLTLLPRFEDQLDLPYRNHPGLIRYPKLALQQAIETTPKDGTIIVTGSLYLIGELRRHLAESVEFEKAEIAN